MYQVQHCVASSFEGPRQPDTYMCNPPKICYHPPLSLPASSSCFISLFSPLSHAPQAAQPRRRFSRNYLFQLHQSKSQLRQRSAERQLRPGVRVAYDSRRLSRGGARRRRTSRHASGVAVREGEHLERPVRLKNAVELRREANTQKLERTKTNSRGEFTTSSSLDSDYERKYVGKYQRRTRRNTIPGTYTDNDAEPLQSMEAGICGVGGSRGA